MAKTIKLADWKRLGTAVQAARIRAGHDDMAEWADRVGRSTRVLLGLERGESTGAATLRRIEDVLAWPVGHADRILSDERAETAPDRFTGDEATDAAEQMRQQLNPSLGRFTDHELLTEIQTRMLLMASRLHAAGDASLLFVTDPAGGYVVTSRPTGDTR